MPSLPKKLIDSAAHVARKAVEVGSGLLRREDDTTVPPPAPSPSPSPSPEGVGAPRPGAPAGPKSATVTRKPEPRAAKVKRSGRASTAKAGPATKPGPAAKNPAAPKPAAAKPKPVAKAAPPK